MQEMAVKIALGVVFILFSSFVLCMAGLVCVMAKEIIKELFKKD